MAQAEWDQGDDQDAPGADSSGGGRGRGGHHNAYETHDQEEEISHQAQEEFLRCWIAGVVLALLVPGALLCWLAALMGSMLALPLGARRAGLFILAAQYWIIKLFRVTIRALLGDGGADNEAEGRFEG